MYALLKLILNRLAHAIPTLVGIIVIAFILLSLAPGDVVDILAADGSIQDAATAAAMRAKFGLDQPLPMQALNYVIGVFQFNFGYSPIHSLPVSDLIVSRLPATFLLMASSILLSVIVGVVIGLYAALNVRTWKDFLGSVFAILFFAAPSFWVGLMLMVVFSIKLELLPVSGMVSMRINATWFSQALDIARHLILPTCALGLFYAAIYARVMRAAVLQVSKLDFVETARAKGVPEGAIAFRHILRNAVLPVITLIGLQTGNVMAGAVVIEQVFSWPGIGTLLFDAVLDRNLPVVMGVLILSSVIVMVTNLIVDILYFILDPRIQLEKHS